jgi:hypothetical protein
MRIRALCGISMAVLLAGCSPSGPEATAPLPRLGLGNDPDRIRVRDQRREPFTATVNASCNGEPVVVMGMANFILQAQDNPADNTHFRLHTNLQGVSGVGAISGDQYHLTQVHNATYNYVAFLEPPRFETNQVFRYRLIGQRPDNNTWLNVSLHLTVTPDGRISSTSFRLEQRCAEDG